MGTQSRNGWLAATAASACLSRAAQRRCKSLSRMPHKTKDGWASRNQIKRQAVAWKRSRRKLIEKLGDEVLRSSEALERRATTFFNSMDTNGDGSIDHSELKAATAEAGIELTDKEVVDMINEADQDGDELIDLDEFTELIRNEVNRHRRENSSSFDILSAFCV